MKNFSVSDIAAIRRFRHLGFTVEDVSGLFSRAGFGRDDVLEAWWATMRLLDDRDAYRYVARVQTLREREFALINGEIATKVARNFPERQTYAPDFDD